MIVKKSFIFVIEQLMKPIIIIAVLFCFMAGSVQAQQMEFGLKGGVNIGTPVGVAEEGASGSLGVGPLIGMYFAYDLSNKWAIHGEFLYSYKGSKFHTPVSGDTIYRYDTELPDGTVIPSEAHTTYRGTVDGKFNNRYLDVPLFASYALGKRFKLLGGAYISYLLYGENKGFADIEVGDPESPFTYVEDEEFDQSSELNTWDYGVLLGTTFDTGYRINVGLSATTGLRSIYRNNYKYIDGVVRNVYLQAFLQFRVSKRN